MRDVDRQQDTKHRVFYFGPSSIFSLFFLSPNKTLFPSSEYSNKHHPLPLMGLLALMAAAAHTAQMHPF